MALSTNQWQFIAHRLLCTTDKEAAERMGIAPPTVAAWKQDSPEFVTQYEGAFADGVHVAQEYTRKLLGKAAQRLNEGLDAVKTVSLAVELESDGKRVKEFIPLEVPDHHERLKAVELLFRTHGLLLEKRDITSGGKTLRIVIDD